MPFYSLAVSIIRDNKSVRILSNALLIVAQVAIAQGNTTKAKALLTEALLNSNKIGDRVLPQDVYYQLWKLIESKNKKLALLYYQNQYLLMRDTMKSLDWRVRKMN